MFLHVAMSAAYVKNLTCSAARYNNLIVPMQLHDHHNNACNTSRSEWRTTCMRFKGTCMHCRGPGINRGLNTGSDSKCSSRLQAQILQSYITSPNLIRQAHTKEGNHRQASMLDLSLLESELTGLILTVDQAQGVKVATCSQQIQSQQAVCKLMGRLWRKQIMSGFHSCARQTSAASCAN